MSQAAGEAALQLPWLSPCAASLVALARAPTAAVWAEVRFDPGCVLLLLRHALPPGTASGLSFFPALLRDPAPFDAAARQLEQHGPGYAPWDRPPLRAVLDACHACARLASLLAERTDRCAPDNAWAAGLLAPLGWLAAGALGLETGPGFDAAALARRLNRLWKLPGWLATATGHLGLPADVAQTLGADPALFQVVQLAALLAREQGVRLPLAVGAAPAELIASLGLTGAEVEEIRHAATEPLVCPFTWAPPEGLPLLPDLIRLAAENRRVRDWPSLEAVQQDVDALQRALEGRCAGEAERLQRLKLSALAELAAGAGHEINNPLAVISGQAQYLLKRLQLSDLRFPIAGPTDEDRPTEIGTLHAALCNSLRTIVNQTTRIHQTLTDLMQFARPSAPKKQLRDVADLVRGVAESLREFAEQRRVRLVCPETVIALTLHADPGQALTALRCLLRNGIEAAPADGWAGVRVEADGDAVEFLVEDSGPGPGAADREHLFDPFYSGRKAGRGRGLGLSTAWRLARENDGDVRHDTGDSGPTRFTLRLPRSLAVRPEPSPGAPEAGDRPVERNGTNGCHVAPAATP